MIKKYIAYQGLKFNIEWYFNENDKSISLDYYEELPEERRKKVSHLIKVLGNIGKIFNEEKFRYEGDQIYAIKTSPDRFFCFFFSGSKIIITNAYEKKSNKMPVQEKDKALKYKEDYTERCKKGTYYEKD